MRSCRGGFIRLGYDFFRGRDTLEVTLVQADAFDLGEGSSLLGRLVGKVDFIHLGMVLHLFGWEKQRELPENCVKLLRPSSLWDDDPWAGRGGCGREMRPGGRIFVSNAETFNNMDRDIRANGIEVRVQSDS